MTTRRRRKRKVKGKKRGKMVRVDFMTQKIVPRWQLSGFPEKFTAKLRYVQEFPLDPFADANDNHSFRANGIFDPDFAIGGHQPLYSDEIYAVYGRSLVVGSKITVRWIPNATGNLPPGLVVLFKNSVANTMTLLDTATVLEQSNVKGYQVSGLITGPSYASNYTGIMHYSPKKDLGFDNPQNEEGLRGTLSSGPALDFFFEVYLLSIAQNNVGNTNFIVQIDYLTEFFDKNHNDGS